MDCWRYLRSIGYCELAMNLVECSTANAHEHKKLYEVESSFNSGSVFYDLGSS